MAAYYNENDPKAAEWLRQLIVCGEIAAGDVDERSIGDVCADEIRGYEQCHFFAGIGGWSYALRLAGWPDNRPVWTGSCPCQPFSTAGKRAGTADERHLWPSFLHLIEHSDVSVLFGEQVASKDGLVWLSAVQNDMEARGFTFGAADLPAAGVGAPHIRQRLFFVGHSRRSGSGRNTGAVFGAQGSIERRVRGHTNEPELAGANGELADDDGQRLEGLGLCLQQREPRIDNLEAGRCCEAGVLEYDAGDGRVERRSKSGERRIEPRRELGVLGDNNNTGLEGWSVSAGRRADQRTAWTPSDFVWCRDGKWRPVEPGAWPLAHGVSGRVGLLRGYGNAIVPQVAAEFIGAYLDTELI